MGHSPSPLLMSMSEAFSVPVHTLLKLCDTKALEWLSLVPGPETKSSSSEIKSLTPFTISYHPGGSSGIFRTRSGSCTAQERPRGATPRPRSEAVAERRYSTSKVRSSGCEEIPNIQGEEWQLQFVGAAVKRYPTSKLRETQVRW